MSKTNNKPDVTLNYQGTLVLFKMHNKNVLSWVIENCQGAQFWGNSLVVEPRYVDDLIIGMEEFGFNIQ